MLKIKFIGADGNVETFETPAEGSLMELARSNGVSGIDADCGGACACATCHIIVDEAWIDRVGDASGDEQGMLEFVASAGRGSRLSCQIELSSDLDGLVVRIPDDQRVG